MTKTPAWLTYDAEGAAIVTLSKPLDIDGAKVTTLRMREPDMNDQLAGEAIKGTPGEVEVAIFANLCEQTPGDIRKLKLRDWLRLQRAYQGFTD